LKFDILKLIYKKEVPMKSRTVMMVIVLLFTLALSPFSVSAIEIEAQEEVTNLIYEIRPGDTLSEIAQLFWVRPASIVRINEINDPNLIYAGGKLFIPVSGNRGFARISIPRFAQDAPGAETLGLALPKLICNAQGQCVWQEPNTEAWSLAGWSQGVFIHRSAYLGRRLNKLQFGDEVLLYRGWEMTDVVKYAVVSTEIIKAQDIYWALMRTNEENLAIITCEPEGQNDPPSRLVIWAKRVE